MIANPPPPTARRRKSADACCGPDHASQLGDRGHVGARSRRATGTGRQAGQCPAPRRLGRRCSRRATRRRPFGGGRGRRSRCGPRRRPIAAPAPPRPRRRAAPPRGPRCSANSPEIHGGEVDDSGAPARSTSRLSAQLLERRRVNCATCWACASRCVVFARASSRSLSLLPSLLLRQQPPRSRRPPL